MAQHTTSEADHLIVEWLLGNITAAQMKLLGYDVASNTIRVTVVTSATVPTIKSGTRVGAGTIVSLIPASGKKVRIGLFSISTDAAGKASFQYNLDDPIDATPTWSSDATGGRFTYYFGTGGGSVIAALMDRAWGPAGDNTNPTVKIEAESGAGNWTATFMNVEETA